MLEIGDMTRTIRTNTEECDCHEHDPLGPCWLWKGAVDSSGYASWKSRNKVHILHRWVYDRYVGPIELKCRPCNGKGWAWDQSEQIDCPDCDGTGLDADPTIDHLCIGHRNCIRPDHMEIVSRVENSERANVRRNQMNYRRKK